MVKLHSGHLIPCYSGNPVDCLAYLNVSHFHSGNTINSKSMVMFYTIIRFGLTKMLN